MNHKELFELDIRIHQKICALSNYSEVLDEFEEWGLFELAASQYRKGKIDKKIEDFLDYLLLTKGISDYTMWAYKTPWVRQQILERQKVKNQMTFYFEDLEKTHLENLRKIPIPSFIKEHKHYFLPI